MSLRDIVFFYQKFCRLEKFVYLCNRIKIYKDETEETRINDAGIRQVLSWHVQTEIFGGVILAGIMNLGVENIYLFGVGGVLVAFFAAIGFNFYAKSR